MEINGMKLGTWEVEGQGQPITGVLGMGHNKYICKLSGWEQNTQDGLANLISAAPELLEACKDALNWMRESEKETGKPLGEGLGYKGRMQKPVIANKLFEAIAAAEGRE